MKYVGSLIRTIRERTNNTSWQADPVTGYARSGISDSLILSFLNEDIVYVQSAILNLYPHDFVSSVEIPLVGGQEAYPVPGRLFANNRIIAVELSVSGEVKDYERLRPKTIAERNPTRGAWPTAYIRTGNVLYLNPVPQTAGSAKVRVTYYRALDRVDVRRGAIASTGETTLVLANPGADSGALSQDGLEYICACDKHGNVILRNGSVESYNSGTFTITLDAAVTTYLESGYAASDLEGAYVTIGRNTTTHSELPDNWEPHLLLYAQKRMLAKDSSTDVITEQSDLKALEREALQNYAQPTEDVHFIPILDLEFMY